MVALLLLAQAGLAGLAADRFGRAGKRAEELFFGLTAFASFVCALGHLTVAELAWSNAASLAALTLAGGSLAGRLPSPSSVPLGAAFSFGLLAAVVAMRQDLALVAGYALAGSFWIYYAAAAVWAKRDPLAGYFAAQGLTIFAALLFGTGDPGRGAWINLLGSTSSLLCLAWLLTELLRAEPTEALSDPGYRAAPSAYSPTAGFARSPSWTSVRAKQKSQC